MRNDTIKGLVLTALFAAIIIIMAYTPLGYIPLVVINATIIHIPVILGSLFCGPKKGAFLGFIFGFTSFLKNTLTPTSLSAFVFSPVIAAGTVGISGVFKSAFICFVPRILVGVLPYFIYKGIRKLGVCSKLNRVFALAVAGAAGAMTNTLLVMGGIYVLYKDAYAEAQKIEAEAVLGLIGGVISFNGVIEAALAAFLVAVIGLALLKVAPIEVSEKKEEEAGVKSAA
ncbi:MAG: ECF transporter S component [Acetatifactor sp.]|nr:ECF transporter S component [Acetatifactor sp.]